MAVEDQLLAWILFCNEYVLVMSCVKLISIFVGVQGLILFDTFCVSVWSWYGMLRMYLCSHLY